MKIVLLGSVNPLDLDLSKEDTNSIEGLRFGRSIPVSDLAISLAELNHDVTIIGIASISIPVMTMTTKDGIKLVYVQGRRQEKLKAISL